MSAEPPVVGAWPPEDGRRWDSQCSRCGSSTGRVQCESCDGSGHFEEDDPEALGLGVEVFECDVCDGFGGWQECISSAEWCHANPIPGCEALPRGRIEWFTVQE